MRKGRILERPACETLGIYTNHVHSIRTGVFKMFIIQDVQKAHRTVT